MPFLMPAPSSLVHGSCTMYRLSTFTCAFGAASARRRSHFGATQSADAALRQPERRRVAHEQCDYSPGKARESPTEADTRTGALRRASVSGVSVAKGRLHPGDALSHQLSAHCGGAASSHCRGGAHRFGGYSAQFSSS